jgi:dethiobiotin synthetase
MQLMCHTRTRPHKQLTLVAVIPHNALTIVRTRSKMRKPAAGLFITGTDTAVGKTYVTALIARSLTAAGYRVGVYKPAASGCQRHGDELVSDDAVALWNAAGRPGQLERVCPQRFEAPLAPHLAAAAEGRKIDAELLRGGLDFWTECSDIVLVEGAGGLMSPLGEEEYVADLAWDFRLPTIVVARNALGTINHTLQTLITAATFREGLPIAGVVMNQTEINPEDVSVATNLGELQRRCVPPVLGHIPWNAERIEPTIDWMGVASP